MKPKRMYSSERIVYITLLMGFVHLAYGAFSGTSAHYLLKQSGEYAMWAFIFCLLCTPVVIITGRQHFRRLKKPLGISAFLFGALHLVFFFFRQQWQMMEAIVDMFREINLIMAAVTLLIMAVLFLTSNRSAIRRLRKRWKPLHRLAYSAAVLAGLHALFIDDMLNPHGLKYLLIVIILLFLRIKPLRRFFRKRIERRRAGEQTPPAGVGSLNHSHLVMLVSGAMTAVTIMTHSPLLAEESYRYDRDKGFMAMMFAADRLPVVTHDATRQACGSKCHAAYLPGLLPERSWGHVLSRLENHFGENAAPDAASLAAIREYLRLNAADYTKSRVSMKIMDSIGKQTPTRITETALFKKYHDDIPPHVIRHDSIGRISNCEGCHIDVGTTGDFDEDHVRMPEH